MFFGLVTAVAEIGLRVFSASVLGRPFHNDIGTELIWMVPLADAFLFGMLGLLIGLPSIRWRGDRLTRVAFSVLVAVAVFTLLLYRPSFHIVARILLSVGVGAEAGRFLSRHRERIIRLATIATWPAICVVLVTASAFRATAAVTERRGFAHLSPAAPKAPNVLLVVLDVVRAADLSLYGYARPTTPNLERLAKSSVVFERVISTSPWTLPSHASLFTGHYPHELSADWEVPLDDTYKTLAESLRDRGYATAGFVANLYYGPPQFGLSRGFLHYESRHHSPGEVVASSRLGGAIIIWLNELTQSYYLAGRMNAAEVNRRLLGWLPERGSRPFFVFVNYFDAHSPYVAPAPYDRRFSGREPPTREIRHGQRNTPAELRGMHDAYDGSIAYIDSQLGVLLRELERRGELSNTLVIITADHGEEFGEHGWVAHGNGLYLPALHVPLLIAFPGRIDGGIRVAETVTLRDIPATVVDLLGIGAAQMPGRSLVVHWASAPAARERPSPVLSEVNRPRRTSAWYAVAKGRMRSIIVGNHHYILNGDGREELYDIVADPWETIDLAKSDGSQAILDAARKELALALGTGVR